jgi:hypothetical protein
MANPGELAHAIDEYQNALSCHLVSAREYFDNVDRAWVGLSYCYAGQGADEFRPAWEETVRRFREYLDQSAQLAKLLEEKSCQLREVDRSILENRS